MPLATLKKKMSRVFGRKQTATPFRTLASEEDLEEALTLSESEPVVLFKHSAICGVSFMARRQMEHLLEGSAPPVYEVVVQQSRSLSNQIAERFGIRHQSPQAIILFRSLPVFNTSHGNITTERIRQALRELSPSEHSDS